MRIIRNKTKPVEVSRPKHVDYPTSKGNVILRGENYNQDLEVVRDVLENDSYHLSAFSNVEYIVDIGSHIGAFSILSHMLFPQARIVACECCPENIDVLHMNVDPFANVLNVAVTYEKDVALLNSVFPNCCSTGGSIVCKPEQMAGANLAHYWKDTRPMETMTLEEVIDSVKFPRIDILKLDCEGSEYSILENTTSLHMVRNIIGEWHGSKDRFLQLVENYLSTWTYTEVKGGEYIGLFWLTKD